MIHCSNCNAENPLDRILCISCGKELDFSSPDLFVKTEEIKAEKLKANSSAAKVKVQQNNIFSSITRLILFSIIFTFAFLLFSTSHIPIISMNEKIKNKALNKINKIKESETPEHYVTFNSDELSSIFNDVFQNNIEKISENYPAFLKPKNLCTKIYSHSFEVFLEFSFISRPIIISIRGNPYISNSRPIIKITSARFGRIPFPIFLAKKIYSPITSLFKNLNLLPEKVISLEIDKEYLSIYKSKIRPKESSKGNAPLFNPLPEDILLIQAADNFLMRKQYNLARRYYMICIARYPKSPLKKYVKEQISIIGNS